MPHLKPLLILYTWWKSQRSGTQRVSWCRRKGRMAQLVQILLSPIGVAFFGLYIYSVAPFPTFWRNKVPLSLAVWCKTIWKYTRKSNQIPLTCFCRAIHVDSACRHGGKTVQQKIFQHNYTMGTRSKVLLPDVLADGMCRAEAFLLESGCIILFMLSIGGWNWIPCSSPEVSQKYVQQPQKCYY